jgi:hypothetical protein
MTTRQTYQPTAIDCSQIDISKLEPILDWLTRHEHDVWARLRTHDRWTYCTRRDDDLKLQPLYSAILRNCQNPCAETEPYLSKKRGPVQTFDASFQADSVRGLRLALYLGALA